MTALYRRKWKRQNLMPYVGSLEQVAGIKPMEATDGFERGSRVFEVWTGSGLNFHVLADRALDISSCRYKGMSLAWRSSVGDAHPAYYDASGTAWLRSFQGGMLVTCGLDTFGKPIQVGEQEYGLHGRVSNTPARAVNYSTAWQEDQYCLEISGEIRQTSVFGENLVMRRRIMTAMGSNRICIEDVVTNESFSPQRHMMLYHINSGFPLLSEKAHLKFDVRSTTPFDENSRLGLGDWMVFQPPTQGYQEQNFVHEPVQDPNGWAVAVLENPELKLGLRVAFDTSTLPFLNEWKMMGEGLYVVGIEPINCTVGRVDEPEGGQKSQPVLEAGESRAYAVEIEVVDYS